MTQRGGETLTQSAYRRIKQDILAGRITPDAILSERALADSLGISRTPLRAALSQLEREDVIARLSNGAITVRAVPIEQVLEIAHLRRALESAAAARAAERVAERAAQAAATDTDRGAEAYAALRATADLMRPVAAGAVTCGFAEFWDLDERFHLAVARAAGLTLLPQIITEQRAIARRSTIGRRKDEFATQSAEHLAVLDAIEAGDAAAARAAMLHHFDRVHARFLASLDPTP
ncbi:GntR family transcriptional regulator [Pacificitalea manganoxidans]|uniref:GntR family transcriptional regulator n=1 Tax=Pacificitalea manganoxidans TaxID=1411902 RepID=A0A291LXA1_9RHOB|nr:GntR family transcriptional regulator [Pacificitalea manganoxidans]ATI41366.1 GntR family transcriptional regulator [Pacificitalea manganoxidans]MDR6308772.1 DNA-binding GntR family transcriptional regulator [Pacificitalea manganoxidans]